MAVLLSAVTTSSTGSTVTLQDTLQNRSTHDKVYTVYCYGTFNGCTVKVQVSPDNTNWIDAYSFTSQDAVLLEYTGLYIRGVVSSAGASTSVSLRVE